jgi:cyclase
MRVILGALVAGASIGAIPQSTATDLFHVEIVRVADGIYVAQRPEPLRPYVEGNVTIIINDRDVVLVDAGGAPSSARNVIAAIRRLTPLPVRYVITTHIHRDHRLGVQEYLAAYPAAEVIAHPDVARVIAGSGDSFIHDTITRLQSQRAPGEAEIDRLRRDAAPGHETVVRHLRRYYDHDLPRMLDEYRTIRNIAPTLTVADRLTLVRGQRTIEVRFLGRGDTPEDLIVLLPSDRVVVAGDMVVHPVPYGFSEQPREWIATLTRLAELDFDRLVPGHGSVQEGKSYVRSLITAIQSVQDQVSTLKARGLDLAAVQAAVGLHSFERAFAGDDPVARYYFGEYFRKPAIERAFRANP